MNLTLNLTVPPRILQEEPVQVYTPGKPAEEDLQPNGSPMIPLQGAPIAMLLFALTRATTTDAAHLMTPAQLASLQANAAFYNLFKGTGASAWSVGNGITLFQNFFVAHPEFVPALQAAQAMYPVFKQFITDAGIWDDGCQLKYSQLANMANIDWGSLE